MAVVDVLNTKAEKVSEIDLPGVIFDVPVKISVLHEVVKAQLASKRAGSASVKHRSDVAGTGAKPYKQKGTGRARRGDIKSPLLRGGGSVFGPDIRSYAYKVPKKIRKLALKMALSSKLKSSDIIILDMLELEMVKTRLFVDIIKALNIDKALIITDQKNINVEKSAKNVPNIKILRCDGLNVYDILKYNKLILLADSIKKIEGRLLS
jgi:large subunit ribosomal protein L4